MHSKYEQVIQIRHDGKITGVDAEQVIGRHIAGVGMCTKNMRLDDIFNRCWRRQILRNFETHMKIK